MEHVGFIKIVFHLIRERSRKSFVHREDLIENNFHKALVTSITHININLFGGHKSAFSGSEEEYPDSSRRASNVAKRRSIEEGQVDRCISVDNKETRPIIRKAVSRTIYQYPFYSLL